MALAANLGVVLRCRLSAGNVVRVVATLTGQLSAGRQIAARLAQTVHRVHNLEFAFSSRAWRIVEVEDEIAERLTGPVGVRTALEPSDHVGQPAAGCLQVALHA